ncbi:MAG: 30S ribosomal protein S2 [Patescibacteria group bacterium]
MIAVKEKTDKNSIVEDDNIKELFSVGAHYAYGRSKRHPSAKPYIFGVKNNVEIFDLEKTEEKIKEAENFFEELGRKRAAVLFVGGKNEASRPIENNATRIDQPYVSGRWVGGTLTNFSQISKRVQKLDELESDYEKGVFAKYTKKERLLLDREIGTLKRTFGGIRKMNDLPKAMFIVDISREYTALREAKQLNIPVITLSNSNCDLSEADIAIPGNSSVQKSIDHILSRMAEAYENGMKQFTPEDQEK